MNQIRVRAALYLQLAPGMRDQRDDVLGYFIPGTGGQYADMMEAVIGKSGTAHAVGAGEVGVESASRRGSSVAEQLIRNQ